MNHSAGILQPNIWNKWFGSWQRVEIEADRIVVVSSHSNKYFSFRELGGLPSISVRFFSVSIELELDNSEPFLITGISKRHINTELKLLEENCLPFIIDRLLMYVQDINEKIYKRFLRDSWVKEIDKKVDWVLNNYAQRKTIFCDFIDASTQSFIDGLRLIHPIMEHKEEIRSQFESYKLSSNRIFFLKLSEMT